MNEPEPNPYAAIPQASESEVNHSWDSLMTTESLTEQSQFSRSRRARCSACPKFRETYRRYKRIRRGLRRKYSYSVPSPEVVEYMCQHAQRVLEIGAGLGYWCSSLRAAGCSEVLASDIVEPDSNHWVSGQPYISDLIVTPDTEALVKSCHQHTLLMQWIPPRQSAIYAINALRLTDAGNVFVVGEPKGGASANENFFAVLQESWIKKRRLTLPRFPGVLDSLYHYARRD